MSVACRPTFDAPAVETFPLGGVVPVSLRKFAAARLVEAGGSSKEVAAITGHASLREIERYTKAVEQEKLARQAIARLIRNG